ncbi:MAG: ribonuclease E activity regulator RraA [Woeseiaceae bacterium]|nr:ribonuclease E activity regulator RraA [Woeseiaceae bacterium]
MTFSVCDLCDAHEDRIQVADPIFRDFGGRLTFGGKIATISCHEDNSLVRDAVASPGEDRVLIVDGGGSLQRSLLGDRLAGKACENGWQGIIVHGAIRDIEVIADIDIGVKALNVIPLKTEKRGLGERDVPVRFAGVTFTPGAYVYADRNGVIVSEAALV